MFDDQLGQALRGAAADVAAGMKSFFICFIRKEG
jgi:hypothetical protein